MTRNNVRFRQVNRFTNPHIFGSVKLTFVSALSEVFQKWDKCETPLAFFPCIKNAQMLRFFDSLSPNPFIKKSFAKIFS